MTAAVTSLAEVAAGRRKLAQGGPKPVAGEAQIRQALLDFGPLWATRPTVATGVYESGHAVVAEADLAYVAAALADAAEYQEIHLGQTCVAAAYRRIYRALGGQRPGTLRPGSGEVVTAGGVSDETVTGAAVEMASSADRARLLAWLWASDPALVQRGVQALREAAVINADRARRRANRKATLRYRRRHRIGV